jgi:glucose-6-phosphate 1-dehydrogenase
MMESATPAPPCAFVIFGAAGDLTRRLLMPALYNLRHRKLLPDNFHVIGVARGDKTDGSFRREFDGSIGKFAEGAENGAEWKWLRERLSYLKGDLADMATYRALGDKLKKTGQNNDVLHGLLAEIVVDAEDLLFRHD